MGVPMLQQFIEPVCRKICTDSFYTTLGMKYWPALLPQPYIPSLVEQAMEFVSNLDPVNVALFTGFVVSAGSAIYYVTHRNGQAVVQQLDDVAKIPVTIVQTTQAQPEIQAAPSKDTDAAPVLDVVNTLPVVVAETEHTVEPVKTDDAALEQEQAARLQAAQRVLEKENAERVEAQRLQTERERLAEQEHIARQEKARLAEDAAKRRQQQVQARTPLTPAPVNIQALARPVQAVARAPEERQTIPKGLILTEYFKTHLREKMLHKTTQKAQVEDNVFAELGIPTDGLVPTDPNEISAYNAALDRLNLPQCKI
jgi:hypothetical protein